MKYLFDYTFHGFTIFNPVIFLKSFSFLVTYSSPETKAVAAITASGIFIARDFLKSIV